MARTAWEKKKSFTYDTPPVLTPSTSSFLQLPDPVSSFGEVRRPAAGPFPSPLQDIQDWLKAGPNVLPNYIS